MKKLIASIVILLFFSTGAMATDSVKDSLSAWLKNVSYKLKMVTKGKGDAREGKRAIAGVKGAEQKGDEELYWKELSISDAELTLMEKALEHIEKGNKKKAIENMERLLKDYPESPLAEDARKGLKLLKAEER